MINQTDRMTALSTLADAMLESTDHLALAHPLRDLMTPADFAELCAMIDLCPMHICDAAICADDDLTECADLRP